MYAGIHKRQVIRVFCILLTMSLLYVYFKATEIAEKSKFILRMSVFNTPPIVRTLPTVNSIRSGRDLLILSYMRGGSSMNGQVFRDNDEDFYVYEPLIPYAPYQYFTENRFCEMGTLKCSKMINATSGQRAEETIEKVVDTLKNIYRCNIKDLDDRVLRNIMFQNKGGLSKSSKPWFDFTTCYLKLVVPDGTNLAQYFKNSSFTVSERHKNVVPRLLNAPVSKAKIFQTCLDKLESKCKSSKIRVTKVLRLSLRFVPRLLTQFPNLKVVYIIRDPRGNLNSRILTKWFPVNGNDVAEVENSVQSLCFKMEEDVKMVEILRREFPGRFIDFRLEDVIKSPVQKFSKLFKILNVDISDRHKKTINELFIAKPNFERLWESTLKTDFVNLIERQCKKVLKFYNYEMIYS